MEEHDIGGNLLDIYDFNKKRVLTCVALHYYISIESI